MNENSGKDDVKSRTTGIEADESAITEIKLPSPPKGMSDDEVKKLNRQATDLVKQLGEVTGSKELALLDNMTNMGIQAQRNAAADLDLLKARVGTFLSEGGPSREIASSLTELRLSLDQIDPHSINRSFWNRLADFSFFGRYNPVRTLQKIALRYEPVSRQIAVIETRLRDGRSMLIRDNVELRKLYEQLEAQQPAVQRNAYLGEVLMQHLTRLLQETDDPVKRDRIQGALHDVAMRVQDLRTMEEVHVQYFVSIEMSRQNNNRLGQAVDRSLTLATNIVTVGLAIQSALIRQKRIMEATERTREFLGNLIAANAVAIRTHTQEIGDLYSNPMIAMEKITQAHNDLVEALDIAERLRMEGIVAAKANITKLSQMSASLAQKAGGISPESEIHYGSNEGHGSSPINPVSEN
jgi:uncharacterized protein YaaN involved in tellurite resistance